MKRVWILWTGREWRDAVETDGYSCDLVAPEVSAHGTLDPRLSVLTKPDCRAAVEAKHRAFDAQQRPPRADPGRTIRQAIGIALEALPGELSEFVVFAKQRDAMRSHVLRWCREYAQRRGVILSDSDIIVELDAVILELKGRL